MHILFLSHYFYPEGNAPASRTYDNCKRWVRAGHKVTVVTGVPNVPDGIVYKGYKNRIRQTDRINDIDIVRVWTYIAANKGVIKRVLNYISFMVSSLQGLFIRDVDVIIATSPQFFCALGGYVLSKLKRVPFVVEIRDLWPESIKTVNAINNGVIITFLEKLELYLYKNADHIVVVTDSFKDVIMSRGISPAKISVKKNGVDLSFYRHNNSMEEIKKALGLENKFIVSYIGTLGMAHAIDCLLSVAENMTEHKDIIFLIVGSGSKKDKLIRIKEEKGLSKVMFLDRQRKDKIPFFYECSNVCLVSLRKTELFKTVLPSKMFEIMAMSKPIVQTVDGEARQILEHSGAGIYAEPENVEAIKDAILHIYNNPDEAHKMGQKGRAYVEQNFNRDVLANQYLATLTEIV